MTEVAARTADAVEQRLQAVGTPERAAHERQYLKSALEHVGATVPHVRREAKRAATEMRSRGELVALVEALWTHPVYERRTCAAFLLHARVDLLDSDDVSLVERLVRDSRTWALVDVLAGDVLGELLVRLLDAMHQVDAWASDDDFWVRRAALLSQLKPLKSGVPFARFGRYADAMLDEREFFVRKAIGWVLRETGKQRPDQVVQLAPASRTPRIGGDAARGGEVPVARATRRAAGGTSGPRECEGHPMTLQEPRRPT